MIGNQTEQSFVPGDVPPPDEVTARWWEATSEHRLLLQRCMSCGHAQHPPRALCTSCGSLDHLDWVDAVGTGIVDTFTAVHRAPRPDVTTPYVVARVRLVEGVLVLTRLEGREPDSWRIDDRVRISWTDLPDGRALPTFRPHEA
jgi:uncharacterized OB-fold protein